MRSILFPFLICLSISSISQEWDIFPIGQRNYYVLSDGETVTCRYVDYARQDSSKTVFYFANGVNKYCAPDIIPKAYTTHKVYDSVIKYTNYFELFPNNSSKKFYHNVEPGFSWNITVGQSIYGYNSLRIIFDSTYFGSIMGLNDSLRSYSIKAYLNNDSVLHSVNDQRIILSKHFGFSQTIFFHDGLISNRDENWETIIGIKNDSIDIGFDPPEIEDFMNYQVGDIYKWKEEVRYTEFNPVKIVKIDYWYRDSLTSIESTPEKFTFYFNRKIRKIDLMNPSIPEEIYEQQNHYERYIFSDYRNMFNGSNPGMISSGNFEPKEYILYKTEAMKVDTFGQELIVSAAFHTYFDSIDTLNCNFNSIPDNGISLIINTRLGLIYEGREFLYGNSKRYLKGYKTAHAGIGGDYFPIGINEVNDEEIFSIKPNPADEFIIVNLKVRSTDSLNFSLLNINGSLHKNGKIKNGEKIDISNLPEGIYILQLQSSGHSISKKVIIK